MSSDTTQHLVNMPITSDIINMHQHQHHDPLGAVRIVSHYHQIMGMKRRVEMSDTEEPG